MFKKWLVLVGLLVCFSAYGYGIDSAAIREKPSEVKGWTLSVYDDDIDASAALITELDTTYVQMTSMDTIEVLSSSASDLGAVITLYGVSNAGKYIAENITLLGSDPETSDSTFMFIDQVSAADNCVGTITVRVEGSDQFITSIPIGSLDAGMAQHYNGEKDTYITYWETDLDIAMPIAFELRYYPNTADSLSPTVGYRVLDRSSPDTAGADVRWYAQPIKCGKGGYIAVYGTGSAANSKGHTVIQGYDVVQ